MSSVDDPLDDGASVNRLYFATGSMLAAEDFQAEQTYHRSRLARALVYGAGPGTIAGLRVEVTPATATQVEEVVVHPGIAADPLGRLVEVPRRACIRVDAWLAALTNDDLTRAIHAGPFDGVVADVFLRFAPCERGKTPAFASGPFDATDGIVASRLRDGYQLQLVPRFEDPVPLPKDRWSALASQTLKDHPEQRRSAIHAAILDAFGDEQAGTATEPRNYDGAVPVTLKGHWLFLARLSIHVASSSPGARAQRTATPIGVDNDSRLFVYSAGALATWLGA